MRVVNWRYGLSENRMEVALIYSCSNGKIAQHAPTLDRRMKTTAIAIEAMHCRTLEVIKFGSYYAAKLEGFDAASIRECIRGKRYTHGGFTWRLASGNPPAPGKYMVRYQWRNKMTGREFDQWIPREWDGSTWNLFSGANVVEWRHL